MRVSESKRDSGRRGRKRERRDGWRRRSRGREMLLVVDESG